MATASERVDYSEGYRNAAPFPHASIAGYLDRARLGQVNREIEDRSASSEREFYGQARKRSTRDRGQMGPATLSLIDEMNAPSFLRWIEDLTGIPGLVADPGLFGGGVHQI